ncbi:MAG: O-antigen ligase family protein [Clostridiales bacterium]|nr:O-antigen ligase family protein [Clostridiales bacterium]
MQNYINPSKPSIRKGITINLMFIVFYALYAMVQNIQFSIDGISSFVILLFLLAYGAYYTFLRKKINQEIFIVFSLLSLLIGVGYQYLTAHINTPFPILSYLIIFAKMFMPVVMLIVLLKKGNVSELSMTFWILTIIFIYVLITTIIEFSVNENIVHEMTNMNYANFLSDVKNVASMDQSYAVLPVSVLCVYALSKCKNKLIKILSILGLALITGFIFVAQFTSILFIMLICVMLEILWLNKDKHVIILIFTFVFILLLCLPNILTAVAKIIDSENMKARILEVVAFLTEGDLSGYNLSSRLQMYKDGIVAFLQSPFWGNYTLKSNPHSSFIQFAADLGMLGIVSFIYMLVVAQKKIKKHLSKDGKKGFNIAFLSLVITGLINPIIQFPTFCIMTFLYVPLGIVLIDKYSK